MKRSPMVTSIGPLQTIQTITIASTEVWRFTLNLTSLSHLESEVMSKVMNDKRHLRDNEGLAGVIYHDVHHPMCYCEEF